MVLRFEKILTFSRRFHRILKGLTKQKSENKHLFIRQANEANFWKSGELCIYSEISLSVYLTLNKARISGRNILL